MDSEFTRLIEQERKRISLSNEHLRKISVELGRDLDAAKIEAFIRRGSSTSFSVTVSAHYGAGAFQIRWSSYARQEYFEQKKMLTACRNGQNLTHTSSISYDDNHPWTAGTNKLSIKIGRAVVDHETLWNPNDPLKNLRGTSALSINGDEIALPQKIWGNPEKVWGDLGKLTRIAAGHSVPSWIVQTSAIAAIALDAAGKEYRDLDNRPRYAQKVPLPAAVA